MLSSQEIRDLELKATTIREDVVKMVTEAGSGHIAGPLGMADIFTALYFHILKIDPKKPEWSDRDRVVLSNGHICPVLYAVLAHRGFFPVEELRTLRKFGTRLQGHPHREVLPGLETTSGPLGSGLSQASGMAYVGKMDSKPWRVYCLMSDGEQDAGNTWEGVMFAGKNKLHNLTAIMDRNNIQIDGMTEDIMPLEPIKQKYEAFGWHVIEIDGHNIQQFIDACYLAEDIVEKPTLILAHTIPGKGVDFMEGDYRWHSDALGSKQPNGDPAKDQQLKIALNDLRTLKGKIKSEHQ